MTKHIVIGAGISGIGAAHFAAQQGIATVVLERSERVGGCMHTHPFASLDGFWIEAGGHSCFNSYGTLLRIMEQRNLLDLITAKQKVNYLLWHQGRRRSIVSALHFLELALSLPKLRRLDKAQSSVKEYYEQLLGAKNYRDLFAPAFRSVVCQPADNFPALAMFRKKPRRKDILRSFTLANGLNALPQAIAQQPNIEVRTEQLIDQIERTATGYAVHSNGQRIDTETLTLAVPPDVAAELVSTAAPEIAAILQRIGMVEIDTFMLAVEQQQLQLKPFAGLISVDGPFLSAVSRDFLPDDRYRGFAFHFPGGKYSFADKQAAACAALSLNPEQIAASAEVRNRLPSLSKDHFAVIESLDQALNGLPLAITGNWFLGVSIEDCLTRSEQEHKRLFAT